MSFSGHTTTDTRDDRPNLKANMCLFYLKRFLSLYASPLCVYLLKIELKHFLKSCSVLKYFCFKTKQQSFVFCFCVSLTFAWHIYDNFGNLSEFLQSYIVYKFYEANKMWMWHNRQNLNIYANNFKTVFNAVCVAVLAESLYLALIVDHFHATFSFLTNILMQTQLDYGLKWFIFKMLIFCNEQA